MAWMATKMLMARRQQLYQAATPPSRASKCRAESLDSCELLFPIMQTELVLQTFNRELAKFEVYVGCFLGFFWVFLLGPSKGHYDSALADNSCWLGFLQMPKQDLYSSAQLLT